MLTLIFSPDWVAGRDEILRLCAERVRDRQEGNILLVPELISHDMERRLCKTAGNTASRFAEVLSFTRLARRVFENQGYQASPCLDNGGRMVAMAAVTRQLHGQLKAYASLETKPEFLERLLDTVDEFKRCCITPQDLKAASAQTEGAFAQKLEELALITEAYDALCSRGKRDPRDQMTWLLEQLEDGDFAANHTFFIDGFPDFTRQHLDILAHIIGNSPNVTVTFTCDGPDAANPAFEKAALTAAQCIRIAKKAGVDYRAITLTAENVPTAPVSSGVLSGTLTRQPEGVVTVCRAESVSQEVTAVAEQIIRLVDGGCRYREIGLVCTDPATYFAPLTRVFRRCNIPLYLSGTEPVSGKSVMSTVFSAMEAALGGFERKDVMRYIRSPLSDLNAEECDGLEKYALIWAVKGSAWCKPWTMNPEGLNVKRTEETDRTLAHLNALREQAVAPLISLKDSFEKATSLAQQVKALYNFFTDIHLSENLAKMAETYLQNGDDRNAQIQNQLWEIVVSALEQMYDVLGDTVWDAHAFLRFFTLLMAQYDVGTIPPVLDSVSAGPVTAMRCQQVRHMIVLGASEGLIPSYSGTSGVFSDRERTDLRKLGVPLTGGAMEGVQAEFADIYGVFCGARETVSAYYSAGQPSFIYNRLSRMSGSKEQKCDGVLGSVLADAFDAGAYLLRFGEAEKADALGVSQAYGEMETKAAHNLGTVSRQQVEALYGKELNLSASQVDLQAGCRLAYFLNYGLRARELREAVVDAAQVGTFFHAVLEETVNRVMEQGGFHSVPLEQTMEIAQEYAKAYARENFSEGSNARASFVLDMNMGELMTVVQALWDELSQSGFAPAGTEVSFGKDESCRLDAIPVNGKLMNAKLRGFVDRVDVWKDGTHDFYRVVDYKTGSKAFDYNDVIVGISLQMFIYLYALQGGEELPGAGSVPAGVQYFPARDKVVTVGGQTTWDKVDSARADELKRTGLVLQNSDVLQAMMPEEQWRRMCVGRNKDGDITGNVATGEGFAKLKEFVFNRIGLLVDEIASGNVTPNPYKRGKTDVCTYCPYGALCGYGDVPERRSHKAIKADEFWEEVNHA